MAIETHLRILGPLRGEVNALPDSIVRILTKIVDENRPWPLKGNVFDLSAWFKDRGGIVEPIVEFCGRSLRELEVGWVHSDASDEGHMVYRLDAKRKILVQENGEPDDHCSLCRIEMGFDTELHEDDRLPVPEIPVEKWRKKFPEVMAWLADLEKQRWAVRTKEDPYIRKWWDLIDLYFDVFELKRGLEFAREKGRLTVEEAAILAPLHEALTRYRHSREKSVTSALADPKWAELCELAKATGAKLRKLG